MRKTKIICTIGPASEDMETIKELCLAGMNVARINMSHGSSEDHIKKIEAVKKVREELGLPIAILLDTKGPEYRIKTFKNGRIFLKKGDEFIFTTEDIIGDEHIVSVSYKNLNKELTVGDLILLNNGLISFSVLKVADGNIICKVLNDGELSDRKSMSFPGKVLKQKYLSKQDKDDIKLGALLGVDFIACSFVSRKSDLLDVKKYLSKLGAKTIELIAKIENRAGINNIEEICSECSGIMIGRGDMGVEIPFEELPIIQKQLITKCRLLGKRVITATEMLESMINNPRPTRAEISDVANAVYDGTSAIMLSGETAVGKYPVLTVKTMARIAMQTENNIQYENIFYNSSFKIKNTVDAISHATCGMAIDIGAKVIVICTHSGITARMVSRFRCPVDILGITTDIKTWYRLALSWGVTPVMCDFFESTDVLFYTAKNKAAEILNLNNQDKIVITGGTNNKISGTTNIIKVDVGG